MRSQTTEAFRKLLSLAPQATQVKARQAYEIWSQNPAHPSLRYKKIHSSLPVYSVRIDLNWRALGVVKNDVMVWFWIGPHDEYERLLSKL